MLWLGAPYLALSVKDRGRLLGLGDTGPASRPVGGSGTSSASKQSPFRRLMEGLEMRPPSLSDTGTGVCGSQHMV